MPPIEALQAGIYTEVMATKVIERGGMLVGVSKEIRFLGTKHIKEMIRQTLLLAQKPDKTFGEFNRNLNRHQKA
jgi:hypothetical protein